MPKLKPLVWSIALVLASAPPGWLRAQGPDAASLLETAIQTQVVEGNRVAAIAQYQEILTRFGDQRRIASQALWWLAQCQEQLGRFDDARRTYERVVKEHADNTALVSAAQGRLGDLAADQEWSDTEFGRDVLVIDDWALPTSETGRTEGFSQFSVFSDLSIHYGGSGESRRLQTAARPAAYPVLSPNRQHVAYLSWRGDLNENLERRQAGAAQLRRGAELRVAGVDGAEDRVLVQGASLRWLRPFQWTPDGASVLTLIERTNGVRQLALVAVADGAVSVLKALPWLSVREMSLSADGRFVTYQASAPRSPLQFDFFILPTSGVSASNPERRYSVSVVGQRGARVSETALAVHVLNRIGFGPRAGDVDRVRAMGVDAYIEQQLHPERLADPLVDRMIGGFQSLRMDIPELLEKAGPAAAIAVRRRATIFERPALVERSRRGNQSTTPGMGGGPPAGGQDRPRDLEIHGARMVRAVHSERQLQEVLVDFWMNHFNVNLGDDTLTPTFEELVIRRHAFGRFEDLLKGVARHPRMLVYLDNWRSSAPAEVIEQRLAELRQSADFEGRIALLEREAFLKESKGLNENYARELLELHTMGVDSGYTQQDIVAVARILTGWTIQTVGLVNGREEDGVFGFDPVMHIEGDKVVLGQTFPSGGIEEGEALLTMLAHRPETARFIATKLARRFIADEPPPAVVEAASRTFLSTRGDIRAVVRTILFAPEFRSSEALSVKIKKPFELVASALRAVDATFEDLDVYASLVANRRGYIARMGEQMYTHEAPDGNPDVGPAWMNSNALLVRLDFANALATGRLPGVSGNLSTAESVLAESGVPRPTPAQIEQTRAMLAEVAAAADQAGVAMTMRMGGAAASGGDRGPVDPAALTVAAMLGSPQFQKR